MTTRFTVYNTLTRNMDEFKPIDEDTVRMYTCGPTVYDYAHIGNYRAYIFEDLLRRHLKYLGFTVVQVQNLTDVDDKTIRGARELGKSLQDYTQTYKDAFFQDLETLRVDPAEYYPAATDHVREMIALIERLFEKGVAYQSDDGSVYFSIKEFPDYGKLARLDMDGLRAGARVAQDEYEKEEFGDFALWKAWDEADGDVAWDSPWGRGRPGWHIECSAMSMKYLGESFDIHTGGIDNIFPHHEDEIAQTEAVTGKHFVNYWLHCAHLIVDGKKMSKSLGNFYTLRDIIEKGYTGREIRYVLLATHYRQTLNFSFEGLDAARAALRRIDEFKERLESMCDESAGELPIWAMEARNSFCSALNDDLNISKALAAIFDMIHAGNRAMDENKLSGADARAVTAMLAKLDEVLAIFQSDAVQVDDEVVKMADLRQKARANKDWAEADRLRDELAARGWMVQDTADGPKLKRC